MNIVVDNFARIMASTAVIASMFLTLIGATPAGAQGAVFDTSSLYAAGAGSQGNTTYKTGASPANARQAVVTGVTRNQRIALWRIPIVSTGGLAPIFGMGGHNTNPYAGQNEGSPNFSDTDRQLANREGVMMQEYGNPVGDPDDFVSPQSSVSEGGRNVGSAQQDSNLGSSAGF